ncbi:MAG TPA: HXXEE domain-containing protein [Gemmatimonadaceae bacterium]|nr:HXXEE domain-containing protein [Gemmatimonadaceae bacterium]
MTTLLRNRWPLAWGALTAAFALHVLDEASHDFLALYNASALALRDRFGGLPFPPVFSFSAWLTGLCVAVAILAALTPLIRPGRRWVVVAAYIYGTVHVANAIGHVTVSVIGEWLAPGVLSSPVLLVAAVWLLYETTRVRRIPRAGVET